MIVLCGNLTIPYCGRFFHCFYLEERKNCATALAGHRAAILFNRNLRLQYSTFIKELGIKIYGTPKKVHENELISTMKETDKQDSSFISPIKEESKLENNIFIRLVI